MNREAQLGMTLMEIMIVVIIMALIATGAAVAIIPQLKRAKIKQTTSDIEVVRSAATMYIADNNRCPSVEQLVSEGFLDHSKRTVDAWNNPFMLRCDQQTGEPIVVSRGPDGIENTDDDLPPRETR